MGDGLMSDGMLFHKALESLRNGLRVSCESHWHDLYGPDWETTIKETAPRCADRESYDPLFWLHAAASVDDLPVSRHERPSIKKLAWSLISARNAHYHHDDREGILRKHGMPSPLDEMIKLLGKLENVYERDQIIGWRRDYSRQNQAPKNTSDDDLCSPARQWSGDVVTSHRYFEEDHPGLGLRVLVAWHHDCVSAVRLLKNERAQEEVPEDSKNDPKWDLVNHGRFKIFMRDRLGVEVQHDKAEDSPVLVRSLKDKLTAGSADVAVDLTSLARHDSLGYRAALIATTRIPVGQTRTYGEVAEIVRLSDPNSAITDYQVGNALRTNPIPFVIPCHRVVRDADDPGKWGYGRSLKKKLLELERRLVSN